MLAFSKAFDSVLLNSTAAPLLEGGLNGASRAVNANGVSEKWEGGFEGLSRDILGGFKILRTYKKISNYISKGHAPDCCVS